MSTYGQYCPISRASELFAERWTPLIIRNLAIGCRTFGEILAGAPGLSKTLLSQRLRKLERAGVLTAESNPRGRGSLYELTQAGAELAKVGDALGEWGARWMGFELEHMDPGVVLWAKSRAWDPSVQPRARIVIRFDITDHDKPLWILAERGGAELCAKHPGFDEDLVVTTDRETLTMWHTGRIPLRSAVRDGRLKIDGPRDLVRSFGDWVPLSAFAHVAPAI
jgi:DNA-binding HxlR family transcriptional regulator